MLELSKEVAVVGIGQTEFSKASGRTELTLACEAILNALEDAGLKPDDVDGLVRYDMDSNTETHVVSALGLENLRYFSETSFGGSGQGAVVGHAAMAIASGHASTVVCFRALNERSGRRLGVSHAANEVGGVFAFEAPYGVLAPAHRFGMLARRHMVEFGTTSRQFGMVAVIERDNAQRNPRAMMHGKPLTIEDHQASRMISDPLRLFDCTLESDGAVAVVLTSADRARDLRQPPAYLLGAAQATGPNPHGIYYRPRMSTAEAIYSAADVYGAAGLTAADIDVAMFYDHFSPFVIFALEAYGFCEVGEGGPFVEEGRIAWPDGDIPVNTHGGHLSEAYIHGMNHVLEAVRQVRGESTSQVANATTALVGGAVAQLSSAIILSREPREK